MSYGLAPISRWRLRRGNLRMIDVEEPTPDDERAADEALELMDEIESHPTWNTSPEHS